MNMKKVIILFCFLASTTLFFAQQTHTVVKGDNPFRISQSYGVPLEKLYELNPGLKDNPLSIGQVIILRKGTEYGQIILEPKQTIYGITKQYKISEKELRKLNPDLDNHMKIGDAVTLPLDKIKKYAKGQMYTTNEETKPVIVDKSKTESKKSKNTPKTDTLPPKKSIEPVETSYVISHISSDDYMIYKVRRDDTLFGIINSFDVTVDDLIKLNSSLSNGLKAGMELKIKKAPKSYAKTDEGVLNVAIILPFGYHNKETKYREMSLDFLKGAKYAFEKNAKHGMKIKVKVIDGGTGMDFKKSLAKIDKTNTDLIIGPLFKASLFEVLDHVKTERIPVVAPFANSEDLFGYSNLIMVTTQESQYANEISKEVIKDKSGQKIYIISDNEYGNIIKNQIKDKLSSADIEIVKSISNVELEQSMMTGKKTPATFILASDNKNEGRAFVNKLIEFGKEVQGVRAYSMNYVNDFDNKSQQLKDVSLVYIMDRKIDQDGANEKEIMKGYENKYCESILNNKYAVVGFDIVNDMLSRENSKGEIFKQIKKTQTQLATKFQFVEAKKGGAYINTGFRVVRLK